ncbi:LysR family transcriptional regulator [Streptomyces sp. ODS28]|uniref:LysR family transcriptional regulator n=1 Tax=Streptomyces sp. ODS28 TaxID=3136688 RepID=UPI0031E54E1A
MEIFHLRYFVAVAENLSFSRAARQLHMATSPLSQRVRDLERELDVRLLDRDSHRVELTRAGAALLPIARDALGRFDDIPWKLREAVTGPERNTVFIGVPPALHTSLRDRLDEVQQDCAQAYDLKRWPGSSQGLLRAVQRGDLGLALVRLPAEAEGVTVRQVLREPLGALLPAAEFGDRTEVSLSELTGHTYVGPPSWIQPAYFDELSSRMEASGIHRRVIPRTGDFDNIRDIVANGEVFSITIMDPGDGMRGRSSDATVVLPFRDFSPELVTGACWRADRAEEGGDLHGLIEATCRVMQVDPPENGPEIPL